MAKTIMTVDDAATIRRLISFTLTGAGFETLEAADGMAALKLLAGHPVDLVISDINMPVIDGVELTRRIRQLPAHRATPVLIVTTESDMAIQRKAREAGATGWIVKPFHPDQLLGVVARILKG